MMALIVVIEFKVFFLFLFLWPLYGLLSRRPLKFKFNFKFNRSKPGTES